jgi:lysozyme family protein
MGRGRDMKRKAKAALRDLTFWLGLAVAALGAIEIGLRSMEAQLPPNTYGLANMVVGVLAAVARVALAQLPKDYDDTDSAGA